MNFDKVRKDILSFVRPSYPDIQVSMEPWDKDSSKTAIYFLEPQFGLIYPMQRFHHLTHLIPQDYQEKELAETVWFELAPGECTDDLQYPDEQLIADITPDVMKCLIGAQVFDALDDILCPIVKGESPALCCGDYRNTRPILLARGFTEDEFFDVFHVLMAQGGYCDCEILYNVYEGSRLSKGYWRARAEGRVPYDPHKGC